MSEDSNKEGRRGLVASLTTDAMDITDGTRPEETDEFIAFGVRHPSRPLARGTMGVFDSNQHGAGNLQGLQPPGKWRW